MVTSEQNPENETTQIAASQRESQILDTSPTGFLITRINDGTILFANKAIGKLLAVEDISSVIGTPVPNFYWDPDERQEVLKRFKEEGMLQNYEMRARRVDDSMIWVSISIQPFEFEGETALLSAIIDISDKKDAEGQLAESEQQMRALLDALPQPVLVTRMSDGTVLYANQQVSSLMGIPLDDTVGKQTPDFYQDVDDRKRIVKTLKKKGYVRNLEVPLKRSDGTSFWAELTIEATTYQDEPATISIIENISERKQAEEMLSLSEERFRDIVSSMADWIWEVDAQGHYTYCSENVVNVLGYTPDEMLGKTPFDFMPPEEVEHIAPLFGEIVAAKRSIEGLENWNLHKDGTKVCLLTDGVPILDSDGDLQGYRGVDKNITEHKRAEEMLHLSEKRFRDILSGTADWIWELDSQGRYTYCSENVVNVLGYTSEEMLGKTPFDFMVPEDAEQTASLFGELAAAGKPIENQETWLLRRNGTKVCIQTDGVPILDSAGNLQGYRGVDKDITQRKRAEERLSLSEGRLQGIVSSMADWIWEVDAQGHYTYCSENVVDVLGYTPEEMLGKTPFDFMLPEEVEHIAPLFGEIAAAGKPIEGLENWNLHKDGTKVCLLTDGVPILDSAGNLQGYRGVDKDITQRKEAEERLRLSEGRLQDIVSSMADWIWEVNAQGQYTYCSENVLDSLGYTPEEMLGKTPFDFMLPEEVERIAPLFGEIVAAGKPIENLENWNLRKDGTRICFLTDGVPLLDAAGNLQGYRGVDKDITQNKQAQIQVEKGLNETRMRYEIAQVLAEKEVEDDVLDVIVEYGRLFPKVHISVYHVQGTAEDATFTLLRDDVLESGFVSQLSVGMSLPVSQFPLANFISPDREFISNDFLGDERVDQVTADFLRDVGTISFAAIPLVATGEWLGNLMLAAKGTNAFTEENLYIYRVLAEQGAIAWQAARLRGQIRESLARRGEQIQVSTEIAQQISSATHLKDLFERVVTITKERLGYYHTQLLRYDSSRDAVVLVVGYGEIGQRMLAARHKMPMGIGLIGVAAANGETMMRSTLTDDPDWRPNQLLPDTKGEIAVPIKFGDRILGVLDVQSDTVGALTDDDRLLLESLCGQIAIAIEQTRLRQEMEERLQEINSLYRSMSVEGWQTFQEVVDLPDGFIFDRAGITPWEGELELEDALVTASLTVPGGQTIGSLAVAKDPERPISGSDQDFLSQVSEQVALALESARLFEQSQLALGDVRRSEAQLTDALSIAHMAYWELDMASMTFTFNDQLYELLHTTVGEVGGYQLPANQYLQRFVYPEDMAAVAGDLQRIFSITDPNYRGMLECRIICGDGELNYGLLEYRLEFDEQGQPVRAFGSHLDVTERKRAEEMLNKRVQELNCLTDIGHKIDERPLLSEFLEWVTLRIPQAMQYPSVCVSAITMMDQVYGVREAVELPHKIVGGIRIGSELLGYVHIAYTEEHTFLDEESAFIGGVVGRVSSYIESLRAYEQIESRTEELAVLNEMGRALASLQNESAIYETIHQYTSRVMEASSFYVARYHEDKGVFTLPIMIDDGQRQDLPPQPVGKGLTDYIIQTRESLLLSSNVNEQTEALGIEPMQVGDSPTMSWLGVPLLYQNRVLGVVAVQSQATPNLYTDHERDLLTAIASQAAIALENAFVFQHTQRQAEYESLINAITQKIQGTTTVENALQVTVRELGRALGASRASVQLGIERRRI